MADDDAEVTPEQQVDLLWDYIKGFHAVHLIDTGVNLGLFKKIGAADAGITPGELAAELKLHGHYVDIWCKTAYAYRLLEDAGDGRFQLGRHFDTILVDAKHPRYLAPYAIAATTFLTDDLRRYPDFFRSGDVYSYQDHGQEFSSHIATMTSGFHGVIARKMLPSLPGLEARLNDGAKVLDMGCGAGGLLIRIAKAFPNCVCVGVDVDAHGVDLARENIAAAGLGDRVSVELLDGDSIGHENEFDVVTLFEVLHEIPVAVRPQVLANCHKALKPDAPLFILDETYPSDLESLRKREYNFAIQTAYNELIWGNVVPTAQDQEKLLGDAGFADVQRMTVADYFTAITAWKR